MANQLIKPKRIYKKNGTWKNIIESVYVGPGSIWQNPFKVGEDGTVDECLKKYQEHDFYVITDTGRAYARIYLKGKDLICSCPLNKKCHADILLEVANEVRD